MPRIGKVHAAERADACGQLDLSRAQAAVTAAKRFAGADEQGGVEQPALVGVSRSQRQLVAAGLAVGMGGMRLLAVLAIAEVPVVPPTPGNDEDVALKDSPTSTPLGACIFGPSDSLAGASSSLEQALKMVATAIAAASRKQRLCIRPPWDPVSARLCRGERWQGPRPHTARALLHT
jgi:hypothetical protein